MTSDFELPDGWAVDSTKYEPYGCLAILMSYRNDAAYRVDWHADDSVTQTGLRVDGAQLAYDPTVTAMALCWAADRHLTPRYPRGLAESN